MEPSLEQEQEKNNNTNCKDVAKNIEFDQQEKPKEHMDTITEQEENNEHAGWEAKEETFFQPEFGKEAEEAHIAQTAHTDQTPSHGLTLTCADYEQLSELLGKVIKIFEKNLNTQPEETSKDEEKH
jgi:hypothetical protein